MADYNNTYPSISSSSMLYDSFKHSVQGQLTAHHVGVTVGTFQWLLPLPLSCLAGGGSCHRDIAVVAQCPVGTVLPSSWVPVVIKIQFKRKTHADKLPRKMLSGFLPKCVCV